MNNPDPKINDIWLFDDRRGDFIKYKITNISNKRAAGPILDSNGYLRRPINQEYWVPIVALKTNIWWKKLNKIKCKNCFKGSMI